MQLIHTPRIMVVDDDTAMARMIALVLENQCFRCVVRSNGAQALRAFEPGEVDLIVTDLHMACGDGVALIESVRRKSGVPVVVVTGFTNAYAQQLAEMENVTVLSKPVESRKLLDAVEAALRDDPEHLWAPRRLSFPSPEWDGMISFREQLLSTDDTDDTDGTDNGMDFGKELRWEAHDLSYIRGRVSGDGRI